MSTYASRAEGAAGDRSQLFVLQRNLPRVHLSLQVLLFLYVLLILLYVIVYEFHIVFTPFGVLFCVSFPVL